MGRQTLIVGLIAISIYANSGRCEVAEGDSGYTPVQVHFTSRVANVELDSNELESDQPKSVRAVPSDAQGVVWFGRILRRLPGSTPGKAGLPKRQDVVFAAAYRGTVPSSLSCDANMDGDLSNDPPVRLDDYPDPRGSRSGLIDLSWPASRGTEQVTVHWKIRIVLEPLIATPPRFRIQMVYAMTGSLAVDGRPQRAFLFDGNRDGMYTKDYGDGLFVDADGDGNVLVDPSADEFIPFSVPAQVGGTSYRTSQITLNGADVSMEIRSGYAPRKRLVAGQEAPDFEFEAVDGRQIRLSNYRGRAVVVYFWASWCGSCAELAPALRALYDRFHPQGLEILGVSFDREREPMLEFVKSDAEPWPIAFSGRGFWENSIGRLYGAAFAGTAYLVDQNGKFVGVYGDLDKLARDLPAYFLVGAAKTSRIESTEGQRH
jgi:thiol-disulfide isomerase/thioredoxin